jgi:hypothetical protein
MKLLCLKCSRKYTPANELDDYCQRCRDAAGSEAARKRNADYMREYRRRIWDDPAKRAEYNAHMKLVMRQRRAKKKESA